MLVLRVLSASALLACGQLLLKLAMPGAAAGTPPTRLFAQLIVDWRFWAACCATGTGALLWMWTLAGSNLSIAYPLMVSMSLLIVALAAAIFLGERVSLSGWLGACLVIIGIWLLSRSSR
jgi:undecaprenyl phosphate-alpha-L-ara4N flippase subunit ArnE